MKIWVFEQMHDNYYGQYSWEVFKDKPDYLTLKNLVFEWNKEHYFMDETTKQEHIETYYNLLLGVMDQQEWVNEFEDYELFRLYEKELL